MGVILTFLLCRGTLFVVVDFLLLWGTATPHRQTPKHVKTMSTRFGLGVVFGSLRRFWLLHCERPGGPLVEFATLAPLAFLEELIDGAPLAPLGGPAN